MVWMPAKEASVPNLLPKGRLETANQLTLVTTYGITPVAARCVLAGLALLSRRRGRPARARSARPGHLALYFNALTFLVAALVGAPDPRDQRPARPARGRAERERAAARSSQGWTFVGKTPLVRGLVLGILGAFAAGGVVVGTGQSTPARSAAATPPTACCSALSSSASARHRARPE